MPAGGGREERRIDPADGNAYTRADFFDEYGPDDGAQRWAAAEPALRAWADDAAGPSPLYPPSEAGRWAAPPEEDELPEEYRERLARLREEVSSMTAQRRKELEKHLDGLLAVHGDVNLDDYAPAEGDDVEVDETFDAPPGSGKPKRRFHFFREPPSPAEQQQQERKCSAAPLPGEDDEDEDDEAWEGEEGEGVMLSVASRAAQRFHIMLYDPGARRLDFPRLGESCILPTTDTARILSELRSLCRAAGVKHNVPDTIVPQGEGGQRQEDGLRVQAVDRAEEAMARLDQTSARLDATFHEMARGVAAKLRACRLETARVKAIADRQAVGMGALEYRLTHATRALQRRPSLERVWEAVQQEQAEALVQCAADEEAARGALTAEALFGEEPACVQHWRSALSAPDWALCTAHIDRPPRRAIPVPPGDPGTEWLDAVAGCRRDWAEGADRIARAEAAEGRKAAERDTYLRRNAAWLNDPARWRHRGADACARGALGPDPRAAVLCCAPCQLARQWYAAADDAWGDPGRDPEPWWVVAGVCCAAAAAPCCAPGLVVLATRASIRRRYQVTEGQRDDLCDALLCWPRAAAQHWRELRHRGRDPGGRCIFGRDTKDVAGGKGTSPGGRGNSPGARGNSPRPGGSPRGDIEMARWTSKRWFTVEGEPGPMEVPRGWVVPRLATPRMGAAGIRALAAAVVATARPELFPPPPSPKAALPDVHSMLRSPGTGGSPGSGLSGGSPLSGGAGVEPVSLDGGGGGDDGSDAASAGVIGEGGDAGEEAGEAGPPPEGME